MTIRFPARLPWHTDGWDGKPCRGPAPIPTAPGQYSHRGDMIAGQRGLRTSEAGGSVCRSCSLDDGHIA